MSATRVMSQFRPRSDLQYEVRLPEDRKHEIPAIMNELMRAHLTAEKLLGRSGLDVDVTLLPRGLFYRQTGAPAWVNAMYYKQTILIPITSSTSVSDSSFSKTIKHEYLHAVLDRLTRGSCPGWIEEGLAQLMEGEQSEELTQYFYSWVRTKGLLPLSRLQHGFTELGNDMAPVAYAQSKYAVSLLIEKYGYKAMRRYLDLLGRGFEPRAAFEKAFGVDEFYFQELMLEDVRSAFI